MTTHPCRAPHHTISDAGLIGGATCRCRATCRGPTMACAFWMHGPSAAAVSSRSYGSRSRMVSYTYNLAGVLNLHAFVALAARLMTSVGLGRER
jgi:hypothetical protein